MTENLFDPSSERQFPRQEIIIIIYFGVILKLMRNLRGEWIRSDRNRLKIDLNLTLIPRNVFSMDGPESGKKMSTKIGRSVQF